MAYRSLTTNANLSSTTLFETVANVPTLHASNTLSLASTRNTTGYTAPNLVNTITGVWVYVAVQGSGGTITAALQESTVTKASVTVNQSDLVPLTWNYIKLATPYTYATLTASAYRWQFTQTGVSVNTTLAADSGGTLVAFFSVDNRTGAVGATDDLLIGSAAGSGTTATMTVDGTTSTVGSGANTAITNSPKVIGAAVYIGANGKMTPDTAANNKVKVKGCIVASTNGTFEYGTSGSRYSTYTAEIEMDNPTTSCDFGIITLEGSTTSVYAKTRSYYWTTYASGTGVAADPFITADPVDWDVGDEIVIEATGGFNQTEYRFIITKNSSTSYVLSSTSGGAETALANTHTAGCRVRNATSNIRIFANNTSRSWYWNNRSATWALVGPRLETVGANITDKQGIQIYTVSTQTTALTMDYCILYRHLYKGFAFSQSKARSTHTGLFACASVLSANAGGYYFSASPNNKTLVDCWAFDMERHGFEVSTSANLSFIRCIATDCNQDNQTNSGGWYFANNSASTTQDCESHVNQNAGIYLASCISHNGFDWLVGTKGTNTVDILCAADTFNTVAYMDSNYGSSTLISGYLTMIPGSTVAFQNYGDTTNDNRWYTPYGSGRSTGAGMPDTLVRTASSLAVRFAPEDATDGFTHLFDVPCTPNTTAYVSGYLYRNASFSSGDITVSLTLPGSSTPDSTYTFPTTTGSWLPFTVAALYSGSVTALGTLTINAKSVAPGAYCYIDDFYDAGTSNKIAGFDIWQDGLPVNLLVPIDITGIPALVWAYPTTNLTSPDTTGYNQKNTLTVPIYNALS